jgi:uncharacterized protein DUF3551
MRLLTFVLLTIPVALTISAGSANALPYDPYPWCAVYGGRMGGSSNCGFSTLQQCMATVSGIGGSCEPNQFYNPRASAKRSKASKKRPNDSYHQPVAPFYGYGSGPSPSYFYGD